MGQFFLETPLDYVDLDVRRVLVRRKHVGDFLLGVLVDLLNKLVLLIHAVDAVYSTVAVLLALDEESVVRVVSGLLQDSEAIGLAGLDLAAVDPLFRLDDAVPVEVVVVNLASDDEAPVGTQIVVAAQAKTLALSPFSLVKLLG